MARVYSAHAMVLGKTKLAETDAILTMLASDGSQIRAVAKGLRRPGSRFGARLEPFSVVDVLLHPGRNLDLIKEARCEETNMACREGLGRPVAAALIAEFLEKLTRDGAVAGDKVFMLSCTAMAALGRADEADAGMYAAAHLLKALAMQGLRPAIHECALCGAPLDAPAAFDVSSGGCLCSACAGTDGLPDDMLALVQWVDLLLRSTFAQLADLNDAPVRPLLDLVESWVREHLSMNLRAMPLLKSLS